MIYNLLDMLTKSTYLSPWNLKKNFVNLRAKEQFSTHISITPKGRIPAIAYPNRKESVKGIFKLYNVPSKVFWTFFSLCKPPNILFSMYVIATAYAIIHLVGSYGNFRNLAIILF